MDDPQPVEASLTPNAVTSWLRSSEEDADAPSSLIVQLLSDARPLPTSTGASSNIAQVVVSDGRHYMPSVLNRGVPTVGSGLAKYQVVQAERVTWMGVKAGSRYKKVPIIVQYTPLWNPHCKLVWDAADEQAPRLVPPHDLDLPTNWLPTERSRSLERTPFNVAAIACVDNATIDTTLHVLPTLNMKGFSAADGLPEGPAKSAATEVPYEVHLDSSAAVTACTHTLDVSPSITAAFTSLSDAAVCPINRLLDVLVVIHAADGLLKGRRRSDGKPYVLRRVQIFDQTFGPMTLALWGRATETALPTGAICAIKFVRVGRFGRAATLSSTPQSTFCIEPATAGAAHLRVWYQDRSSTLPNVSISSPVDTTIGEVLSRRAVPFTHPAHGRPFRFVATVLLVDHDRYGYLRCDRSRCRKKVTPAEGGYICSSCNSTVSHPTFAYLLRLSVADHTGCLPLIAFSDVAERLVPVSPAQVMELQACQEEATLHKALGALQGQEFCFVCSPINSDIAHLSHNAPQYRVCECSTADYAALVQQARESVVQSLADGPL